MTINDKVKDFLRGIAGIFESKSTLFYREMLDLYRRADLTLEQKDCLAGYRDWQKVSEDFRKIIQY